MHALPRAAMALSLSGLLVLAGATVGLAQEPLTVTDANGDEVAIEDLSLIHI